MEEIEKAEPAAVKPKSLKSALKAAKIDVSDDMLCEIPGGFCLTTYDCCFYDDLIKRLEDPEHLFDIVTAGWIPNPSGICSTNGTDCWKINFTHLKVAGSSSE